MNFTTLVHKLFFIRRDTLVSFGRPAVPAGTRHVSECDGCRKFTSKKTAVSLRAGFFFVVLLTTTGDEFVFATFIGRVEKRRSRKRVSGGWGGGGGPDQTIYGVVTRVRRPIIAIDETDATRGGRKNENRTEKKLI